MARGARWAASGTNICTTTAVTPTSSEASRNIVAVGDAAASASATTLQDSATSTSRRFSSTSASGVTSSRPAP